MTANEVDSVKIGDRVQAGTRLGILDFIVSNVFLIKWDGGRDSDAYTREAFEKHLVPCVPKAGIPPAAVVKSLPAVQRSPALLG
jgi:hypothetical protein